MPISEKQFIESSERVNEQLSKLRDTMTRTETILDLLLQEQKTISHIVTGNGTPDQGIANRISRLEQNEQSRKWYLRTTLGAAIVALIAVIIDKLRGL